MKRSKIFLGVTTGVLAVVAFTAAKSAKFTARVLGYYSVGNNLCTKSGAVTGYTVQEDNAAKAKAANGKTVFEYNNLGACSHVLYTKADRTAD